MTPHWTDPQTPTGNAFLALDDEAFCSLLLLILQNDVEPVPTLDMLWQPAVLQRLQQVKQRSPHIFVGSFIVPLRAAFPRLSLSDISLAMQGARGSDPSRADVAPDALIAAIHEHVRTGGMRGHGPGWASLGCYYTVRLGELTVVTGVSNHMKSLFMQALCVNLARSVQWQFSIFSPEHASVGDVGTQLMERYAGVASPYMPEEQLLEAATWVSRHFHILDPQAEEAPTVPYLLAAATHQVQRYGIHGLVLDPWNQISHPLAQGQTETQYTSEALSAILRFAHANQVHVWLVAHPTKLSRIKEDAKHPYAGKRPPPTPSDINGSGHFYNKADNCLSIWRDTDIDSPTIEVHVQKVRHRGVGRIGRVELTFRDQQFHEEAPDDGQWHH